MEIEKPKCWNPKLGGLLDALHKDRFIEYLTDEWPTPDDITYQEHQTHREYHANCPECVKDYGEQVYPPEF